RLRAARRDAVAAAARASHLPVLLEPASAPQIRGAAPGDQPHRGALAPGRGRDARAVGARARFARAAFRFRLRFPWRRASSPPTTRAPRRGAPIHIHTLREGRELFMSVPRRSAGPVCPRRSRAVRRLGPAAPRAPQRTLPPLTAFA